MKRIESSSKKWAGYVILHDPLNLEQVFAIEDVQDKSTEIEASKFLKIVNEKGANIGASWSSRMDKLIIPAVVLCVAEWHLENFPENPTVDNFPATPRKETRILIDWLWEEVNKIYMGEMEELPNE